MNKKVIGIILTVVVFVVFGFFGAKWIHYRLTHSITNAVFVEAESFTQVAYKRVAGRIAELYAKEGDRVRKGQPLAKIEDADYRLKLKELESQIRSLKDKKRALQVKRDSLEGELKKRLEIVNIRKKQIKEKLSSLEIQKAKLKKDHRRLSRLLERGSIPQQKFEEVDTQLRVLEREIESLRLEEKAVKGEEELIKIKLKGLKELDENISSLSNQILSLEAKKEDLKRMIEETVLRSPVDGYVVKRYVDIGEVVRQGQYIYAVYDPESLYILALLEENKLQGVEVGNRVKIEIDAFPDIEYEGVVREIGRSTAAKFAIIPRDVTAGEFTKVAQRIPVKIDITKGNTSILRVGMGGEVAIEKK